MGVIQGNVYHSVKAIKTREKIFFRKIYYLWNTAHLHETNIV